MEFEQVLAIAKQTRDKCFDFAMSENSYGFDFHNQETLNCMCAVASNALRRKLIQKGIEAKMVQGEYKGELHCWVEVEDSIIDITATQFGVKEEVYVVPASHANYKKERDNQVMPRWFYEQTPPWRKMKKFLL